MRMRMRWQSPRQIKYNMENITCVSYKSTKICIISPFTTLTRSQSKQINETNSMGKMNEWMSVYVENQNSYSWSIEFHCLLCLLCDQFTARFLLPPPHCRPFHLVCFECFRLFVCEWIRIKSRIESDRNNKSNLDIVWWEWYWVCTESFYICIHIMVWGRLAGFLY